MIKVITTETWFDRVRRIIRSKTHWGKIGNENKSLAEIYIQ